MFTHVVIIIVICMSFAHMFAYVHCIVDTYYIQAYHIITLSFSTIYSTSPIEAPVHGKKTATSCQSYGRAMAKLYREAGHVVDAYLKILKNSTWNVWQKSFLDGLWKLGVGGVEFGSFSI